MKCLVFCTFDDFGHLIAFTTLTYYGSPFISKTEFSGLSVTLNSFLTMLLKISGFVKFLTLSGRNHDSCVIMIQHRYWFLPPCSNILFPACTPVCSCKHSPAGPLGFSPDICIKAATRALYVIKDCAASPQCSLSRKPSKPLLLIS